MTTKDRLKEFLSVKGIGRNRYETQIGVSRGYLSTKSDVISSEVIEKTADFFQDLNLDWLITGKGEMLKSVNVNRMNDSTHEILKTKPRIPYTAAAGSITNALDGVKEYDCEQIPVIQSFPKYDFTIVVRGDSMQPNILGGDEVACKKIDEKSFIQWGKVHVLDTAQGIIVKRIYEDGDKIKCVSYNPEYPPFSIDKKDIYSYNLVVGLLRI
ncbi:S24 family peptidase [Bacteroides mediterraneensis]|uniref:S24 family peptidase n=1 Tax=Bacteroides mediterraneensis TaxID=1841856 RepID=UPI00195D1010|nr:S24 family peptidase [Bacteroides mediterraneensis]MBM6781470.1 S24 family peptidase [Bacteroides mediterraneensis]